MLHRMNWQHLTEMCRDRHRGKEGASLGIWELRPRKQSAHHQHLNKYHFKFFSCVSLSPKRRQHFQCLPQSGTMNVNHVSVLQVL